MNSTSLPFAEQDLNATVIGRFVQIVRQFPEQVAVKSTRQSITYRALDQRSSRMGRFLAASLGLTQQPVALLIEDKADMTVALLAVIRAGHFYSALRPTDPPARLTNLLNDLGTSILLTSEGMLPLAHEIAPAGCRVVTNVEATDPDDSPFLTPVTPESLTGIFYTSGSTGEPKGVPHIHQSLLISAKRRGLYITYGPQDRLLLMYPFSSAASLPFIFNVLLNGPTLLFFDSEKSLTSLADTLLEEHITSFQPPLQLLRSFLDILPANTIFPDIRYVFTLGDVLYRRDVERLWPHLSQDALIFHMLASSESGTLAGNLLRKDTPLDGDILPAGFPVPGTEPILLNEQHQIVPSGEAGEIAVRTNMLFPGYWQRPDLNSQKYVPDPADQSRQLFLTGDIGRFRPDGQLEFIGRADFRVKIRGFNVDMSAIESVLMSIPEIQHAVVLPWTDQDGNKRLVAYISWALQGYLTPGELRKKLAQRLPDYMHPAAFITLDKFPLTATGKLDRKALPAPDWNQLRQKTAYIAPRNETEQRLAAIWQKVLKLEKVGVQDRFADLGGDSLMAAAIFAEIKDAFGIQFPISSILDYDTVEKLASVTHNPDSFKTRLLVPLRATGSKPPLYLFPGGAGDALNWLQLAHHMDENQPLYSIQALQKNDSTIYGSTINIAAKQFLKAIRAFQPHGPYYLAGYSYGGMIAFETAKQISASGEKVAFLGIIDTTPPQPQFSQIIRKSFTGTFPDRVRLHIENMKNQTLEESVRYYRRNLLLRIAHNKVIRDSLPIPRLVARDDHMAQKFAFRFYDPGQFCGPVTFFRASERASDKIGNEMEGWQKIIQNDLQIIDIPGDHHTVVEEPHIRDLAAKLGACIEQAQSAQGLTSA